MRFRAVTGAVVVLWLCLVPTGCEQPPAETELLTATTDKDFTDVVEDLEFAITERNYRVVNVLRIGKAIRERGYDGFPLNSVILYCNLTYARSMLEIEPDYLNHCPARISVRENGGEVLISAHLFPESGYNADLDKVIRISNTHIAEIVEFGARKWLEVDVSDEDFPAHE